MEKKKRSSKTISVGASTFRGESSRGDEVALAQSSELLAKALGSTDAIIFLKDRDGRYLVMSPWYEKKFYGTKAFCRKNRL